MTTTTTTTNTRSRAVSIHYDRGVDIPSSVRSSAASSPDPEYHHSQQPLFPPIRVTSFHNDDDLWKGGCGVGGGGFAARIGRARFFVMMIMVLPLSLGAWVISNHRLYDVSFVFAQDGRVKVKRRTLFRPLSQRSKSTVADPEPEPPLQQQQLQLQPILFVPTTPVPTVSHQNLNPVVSKVKLVAGAHGSGATIRKTTQWSEKTSTTTTTTKKAPRPVAATPAAAAAANDETSGFFRTIRLKHRSRATTTVPITTTPTKKTPPPQPSSPQPVPSSPDGTVGFFRRIRLRRRSADEKRQSTTKPSSVPVKAVTTPVEKTNGIWVGLGSGIPFSRRTTKEHRSDPVVPVFQIRLGTPKSPSSSTSLGLTLRRPAIRKQRAEEARLRLLQEEEHQRMALQSEQERLREAKLVQKQSFRNMVKQEVAKRMEARRDAAAVRSMMEAEAKFAAAQAKEEARNTKLLEAQAQAKLHAAKASTTKKVTVPDCSQILHAAKVVETTGFWRRIRLRQRRGIEKTCHVAVAAAASSTKKISQPQQEISVQTKDWWGPIRFRRRPKEPSVAPADTTTSQSVAKSRKVKAPTKEKSVVKPETPTNVVRQVVEAEAKTKDTSSITETPLKKSKSSGGIVIKRRERKSSPAERHSWLGGVTSIFGSKKRSSSEVANPLVEKNAPENVLPELLRHFTGAPTDVQQQPMVSARARTIRHTIQVPQEPMAPEPKYVTFRIRSKPPKPKRPPAIRIRRVRRE